MSQALETMIRDAYAAFGRGDLAGYFSACTPEFVFHVPGKSAAGGDYHGLQGIFEIAGKVMRITGGTFQEDVIDVLANERHAVVICRHRFTREGQAKEYWTAHVYRVHEGKLAECWEHTRDETVFADAWGAA